MTSYLSRKLGDVLGLKPKLGTIGIELELEGKLPNTVPSTDWTVKPEGSLRDENGNPGGGFEYVMTKPLFHTELHKAIDDLLKHINGPSYKPLATIRCSTHFHVNVMHKTVRQVYHILGMYSVVEGLMVRRNGLNRMGNLFCLRTTDADGLLSDIIDSLDNKMYFSMFNMNDHKYGSVNLEATRRFGSLEFRFCKALLDPVEMKMWAGIFENLVEKSVDMAPKTVLETVQNWGVTAFLETVFTPSQVAYLLEGITTGEAAELLQENVDFLEALDYALADDTGSSISFSEGTDYLQALAVFCMGHNSKKTRKSGGNLTWGDIAETWTTLTDGEPG